MFFLAFFVCVAFNVYGFGRQQPQPQQGQQPPQVQQLPPQIVYQQREPVTFEIINDLRVKNELAVADFYLSVSIKIFFPSLVEERHIVNGDYEREAIDNTNEVQILFDQKGGYVSHANESIDVSFGNIVLSFVRVSGNQVNHYELVSAQRNNSTMQIYFPYDRPYLIIHTKETQNQKVIPAQGIPTSGIYNLQIIGQGKLSKININAIADFICNTRNPRIPDRVAGSGFDRSSVVQIISFYFEEAEREEINPDLAISQMIWSMQYFSEAKMYRDLRQAHDYGGLVIPRNLRNDYWDGRTFTGRNVSERRQIGIRAHIQFLRRSAVGSLKSPPIVLPTWGALANVQGSRKTLEDISKSWSPGNPKGYTKNISDVYEKLTKYLGIRI
jgi:hypothetical protein